MFYRKSILLWGLGIAFFSIARLAQASQLHEEPIRIFAGEDERQPLGTDVFRYSLYSQTRAKDLSFNILEEQQLVKEGYIDEKWDPKQMSPFGRSRFLVPYFSNYKGWSLFADGPDMMVTQDICELWKLRDEKYAVMVVKHPDFNQQHSILGRQSSTYQKFNWSSVMLLNNAHCKKLTPEYVKNADYQSLHQFEWLEGEEQIGELPGKWNHLIGYYPKASKTPSLIHWTKGSPMLKEHREDDYADKWFGMLSQTVRTLSHNKQ